MNKKPNRNKKPHVNNHKKKERAMKATTVVAVLCMAILTLNTNSADAYDVTQNFNVDLLKKAKTKAECTQYMLGAKRACGSAYVDTNDLGYKKCVEVVMNIYRNCPRSGGGGGGGGGGGWNKMWCPLAEKGWMPRDTEDKDCKCPLPGVATNEVKRPDQRSRRKTGCESTWKKGCFVYSADPVKMAEQCKCEGDKPNLNTTSTPWACEGCKAPTPVFDKEKGECISCFDADPTKPYWNKCEGKCEVCPAESPFWNGKECVQCNDEKPIYNEKAGKCEACPAESPNWQRSQPGLCVSCPQHFQWITGRNKCIDTRTIKCPSGDMVADKKYCPPWNPVTEKWDKAPGKCPAGKVLVKSKDPSRPSRCVCKHGGQCTAVPGGCLWWVWLLIGLALGILVTLGVQAGRRRARNRRNPRGPRVP